MRILVVDDERVLRNALTQLLVAEGYAVEGAAGGETALRVVRERRPDLVLLDVMMPGRNGYEVCREIRRIAPKLPVLFLTAKDSEGDELRGFGVGADDYLSKTASESVLLARIAAVVRRTAAEAPVKAFALGTAQVEPDRMKVTVDGRASALNLREVEMLRWFATNVDVVASHDFLLTRFWEAEADVSLAALQMQIARLRVKLGSVGKRLESVHAQGYVFRRA